MSTPLLYAQVSNADYVDPSPGVGCQLGRETTSQEWLDWCSGEIVPIRWVGNTGCGDPSFDNCNDSANIACRFNGAFVQPGYVCGAGGPGFDVCSGSACTPAGLAIGTPWDTDSCQPTSGSVCGRYFTVRTNQLDIQNVGDLADCNFRARTSVTVTPNITQCSPSGLWNGVALNGYLEGATAGEGDSSAWGPEFHAESCFAWAQGILNSIRGTYYQQGARSQGFAFQIDIV